ncbi:hypothetical protein E2493_03865 [Sphingomonas parva]|uniref:DUF2946 domain-containing protein n=1 Tax=Sphingomonas parva TaxID=2555898 RepID=A0A4Y8ZUD1_9SPHN|nr:hypothetical protein [Sphingomonas parva]TFI59648.1 hypothetical protein E2493_03865 [Sphingomonas parva]
MPALPRNLGDRHVLVWLLGLAIALRVLVPAGWMPVFGAHGVRLELCGGRAPQPALELPHHDGQAVSAHAGHGGDKGKDPPPPDQPCAFAAVAAPWLGADLPLPLAPPALALAAISPATFVALGRGLAAPPPPSTGPPLLS